MRARSSKRRLGVVAALCIAVLLAGTAFAFTADRLLGFNGTVSVDASLLVGIDRLGTRADFHAPTTPGFTFWWNHYDRITGFVNHYKAVEVHVDLRGSSVVEYTFVIENLGTMDADVYVYIWELDAPYGSASYIDIWHDFDVNGRLIPVGQSTSFTINAEFDSDDVDAHYINYSRTFKLILRYVRAQ